MPEKPPLSPIDEEFGELLDETDDWPWISASIRQELDMFNQQTRKAGPSRTSRRNPVLSMSKIYVLYDSEPTLSSPPAMDKGKRPVYGPADQIPTAYISRPKYQLCNCAIPPTKVERILAIVDAIDAIFASRQDQWGKMGQSAQGEDHDSSDTAALDDGTSRGPEERPIRPAKERRNSV